MDSSSGTLENQEEVLQTCNWLELPRDVTLTILMKLTSIQVLESAQFVCKLWFQLCKDPALWRIIDGENLAKREMDSVHEKMAFDAVDRSSGGLLEITMKYFGTNELMSYIAERASCLKCLRMRWCYLITDDGLIEAVKKLPLLEEVEITPCTISKEAIKAIGFSCPQLTTFRLTETGTSDLEFLDDLLDDREFMCDEHSLAIAESMCHVRHLQLIGSDMTNDGLQAILDGCPNLESLDLRACVQIDLSGTLGNKCAKLIKNLRLPNEPTSDCKFIASYDSELDEDYDGKDFISDDDYYEFSYDSELLDSDYGEFLDDDDDI